MGTKVSDTASDRFESKVAGGIRRFLKSIGGRYADLEVSRHEGEDAKYYSDVKVVNQANGKTVWIEVKKDKFACFAGPSMKFRDGKWSCTTMDDGNPLAEFYVNAITQGAKDFVSFCRKRLRKDDIDIPGDLSPSLVRAWKGSCSVDDTENDVQFITDKLELRDFGEKVAEYYKTAKREPVYYVQVGDSLYIVDSGYNPLGLRTADGGELKTLAEAYPVGRIQFRAKSVERGLKCGNKQYFSVVCDVKTVADGQSDESGYRCSFVSDGDFPKVEETDV